MGNGPSTGHSSRVLIVWAEKCKLKRSRHYTSKLPLVGLEMRSIGVWAFALNVRARTEQWLIMKARYCTALGGKCPFSVLDDQSHPQN
jgi:hypothetical protein